MNPNYKFNPNQLAKETSDAYSAASYTSWNSVCLLLAQRGFNRWEAEAILRSKWTRWARDMWDKPSKPTSSALAAYLDMYGLVPGHPKVNELVMDTFGVELNLELNEHGRPCRRGSMPGNPAGVTVLVPLGTPPICDPTSETYWSA